MRLITIFSLFLMLVTSGWASSNIPLESIDKTTTTSAFLTGIDSDGDGIDDDLDLDDDNDGILDSEECPFSPVDVSAIAALPDGELNNGDAAMTFNQNIAGQNLTTLTLSAPYPVSGTPGNYKIEGQNLTGIRFEEEGDFNAGDSYATTASFSSPTIPTLSASNSIGNSNINQADTLTFIITGSTGISWTEVSSSDAVIIISGNTIKITGASTSSGSVFAQFDVRPTGLVSSIELIHSHNNNGNGLNSGVVFMSYCSDTDNDGIADYLDLDSDNDGCSDVLEGTGVFSFADIANDTLTGGVDANGIPLAAAGGQNLGTAQDTLVMSTICDADADGTHNLLDLDNDNDGILDSEECPFSPVDVSAIAALPDGEINPSDTAMTFNQNIAGQNLTTLTLSAPYPVSGTPGNYKIESQGLTGIRFEEEGDFNAGDSYATTASFSSPTIPTLSASNSIGNSNINQADTLTFIITGSTGISWTEVSSSDAVIIISGNTVKITGSSTSSNSVFAQFDVRPTGFVSGIELIHSHNNNGTTLNSGVVFMSYCSDTDNDGIADYLDLDSDNDGIADIIEAGGVDTDNDGVADDLTDTDGDGIVDLFDTDDGGTPIANTDSDGDGIPNAFDLDSDNDGIVDIIEAGGVDTDNDGQADNLTDTDNDGLVDLFDTDDGGTAIANTDSDNDGVPNAIDIDSDNDGIVDYIEAQASTGYLTPSGMDTDGDGIDDNFDSTPGFGGALIDPVDTDTDGLNDYLDFDSDDDGETDAVEGNDSNNDGVADAASPNDTGVFTGMDSDGDGLDDGYDNDDATHNPTNATTADDAPENDATDSEMDWRDNAANIAGFVWDDTNGDGMRDATELGIAGVTVRVVNANGDALITSVTTNADGAFLLPDFNAGGATSYYLEFVYPSGYSITSTPDQGGDDRMDSDADATTNRTAPFSVDGNNPGAFFGAGFQSAPLPVEMLGIGFRADCDTELYWNVAQEIGVSTYDVEYSQTGANWSTTGNVTARNASEYTTEVNRSGYYRIVTVDNDGIASTSDIVFREACSASGVTMYPNPVAADANVTLSGLTVGGVVTVIHVDGRIVREIHADADQLDLPLNDLIPGVYIIQHGADVKQLIIR